MPLSLAATHTQRQGQISHRIRFQPYPGKPLKHISSYFQENLLAIGLSDGTLLFFDCVKQETISKSKLSDQPILAIAFKNKSSQVIVNSQDSGFTINLTDNTVQESWKYAKIACGHLSISPNDKYVLECHDNRVTLSGAKEQF
jgi:hypothetical protein